MKLITMKIKQSCKGGPKYEDSTPKSRSKGGQNASFKKLTDQAEQWAPRAGRGGVHGCVPSHARPCVPWPLRISSVFARLFVFRRFLLCFAFIMLMKLDPIYYLIHSIFILLSSLDFRIVLERERGSGEDLRGFHAGRWLKDSRIDIGWANSSPCLLYTSPSPRD